MHQIQALHWEAQKRGHLSTVIGQTLGEGLWEVRGGVSKIRVWGLRKDFPERRCPSIAAKDDH